MGQKDIIVEKKGEIVFLIMNHPETGNLFNEKLFDGVAQALEEVNSDNESRLIIVKGAGDNFCLGGDVARIVTLEGLEVSKFFRGLIKMYKAFHRIDKVTIAMVHGYATAAGFGVALSCDLIVAAEDAYFGATGINVGLCCLNAMGVQLPRVVGSKRAMELGLTGDIISAQGAERLGIVNVIASRERLEPATMELAQKILSKNPVAVAMGRRNFYTCADMEYDKGLEHSAEMWALLAASEEAKEGMRAFLEKRKPCYKRT